MVPMISMSTVRNVFWQVVTRGCGGCSRPRKYGLNGTIPATVNSTDGSCSAGISDADGSTRWSRSAKKSRKRRRISSEVTGTGV